MTSDEWKDARLFDPGPSKKPDKSKVPTERIWTQNKARLISRYIYYFQLVTKHGTYIDGFAGPQDPTDLDAWAAGLVLALEPLWLRHFYLCDKHRTKVKHLDNLRATHPKRDIQLFFGDFNTVVRDVLNPDIIDDREATFCLLDQQTFQCKWSTVEMLASFKADAKNKIEVFYFLASRGPTKPSVASKARPERKELKLGGADPIVATFPACQEWIART